MSANLNSMSGELLIRSVRPWPSSADTPAVDVLCGGGKITAMGIDLVCPRGVQEVDGLGGVLLPGFVDAHASIGSVEAIRASIASGTTLLRGHVPVDGGLESLEEALSAREAVGNAVTVHVVASPRRGVLKGADSVDLLDAALVAGADVVGGIDPAGVDRDPVRHLNLVFGLAEKHQCGIDLLLTDPGELGAFELELICERTATLGMRGAVTITHCYALSAVDSIRQGNLIDALADNDIAVVTTAPGVPEPLPLRRLRRAGVRIGLGQDGGVDMLERAWQLAYRGGYTSDNQVEMCVDTATRGGAAVLGERDHGLVEGARADLVVLPGKTVVDVVTERPPRTLVIHEGHLITAG
jgi:cytosine/creatinine deaminase